MAKISIFPGKKEIDSVEVYYDLIAEENYKAYYGPNVTGIIVGGSLTGVGMFFAGVAMYELLSMPDYSDQEKSINDASQDDGFGKALLGTFCILGAIPFLGVGIPVLSYNIYQYVVRKGHARKRDEYQNALDIYRSRKKDGESRMFQIMLFPSLDVIDKGAALKAFLLF